MPRGTDELGLKTLVLRMNYAESEILNPDDAAVLKEVGCNILSVDIVYTNFRKQEVQSKLNKRRIFELFLLSPETFKQSMTQWKYVEQLGYASEEDAKRLFHGIVIKYRQIPLYQPLSIESIHDDVKLQIAKDTSMFRVFNKCIKFKEELVCVDLTGSMSPYYLQVFLWFQLKKNKNPINFSFFNDGDATPDHLKRTGKVGGVYLCKTNSFDSIVGCAYKCISRGSGGDAPENNIEAAIKGLNKFPKTKEMIMIVDNWADMRDYTLMSEINIPVRVIVCGSSWPGMKKTINTQYLDLAKRTGGSLHTMEEDIEDLAKLKEGETVIVGGEKYQIKGGKFYLLGSSKPLTREI